MASIALCSAFTVNSVVSMQKLTYTVRCMVISPADYRGAESGFGCSLQPKEQCVNTVEFKILLLSLQRKFSDVNV